MFERLEDRLNLSNPAADYLYSPVNGKLFDTNVGDIASLQNSLAKGDVVDNLSLQVLENTLAANPVVAQTGVAYTDIRQGGLADCGLIASLGEIALRSPVTLDTMFAPQDNGTLNVRFYYGGNPEVVNITTDLPAYNGNLVYAQTGASVSDSSVTLWPAYAEKAYAVWQSEFHGAANNYHTTEYLFPYAPLAAVTGQSTVGLHNVSNEQAFADAWSAGECIVFSTTVPADPFIVPNHCYLAVSYDASTHQVTAMSSWGVDGAGQYPGFVTLDWFPGILQDMSYWDSTV